MLSIPLNPTSVNSVEDYLFLSYFILKNLILVTIIMLHILVSYLKYI